MATTTGALIWIMVLEFVPCYRVRADREPARPCLTTFRGTPILPGATLDAPVARAASRFYMVFIRFSAMVPGAKVHRSGGEAVSVLQCSHAPHASHRYWR